MYIVAKFGTKRKCAEPYSKPYLKAQVASPHFFVITLPRDKQKSRMKKLNLFFHLLHSSKLLSYFFQCGDTRFKVEG